MRSQVRLSSAASFAVALGLCLVLAAASHAEFITGLALYCDMEDATAIAGKTLPNVWGDPALAGTIAGNVTQVIDVQRGNVLSFDTRSTSNYVSFGDNLDPRATSYTVAMWVKRDEIPSGSEFVATKGNASTAAEGWSLGLRGTSSDKALSVRANYDGGTGTTRLNTKTETEFSAGAWHHIALVIDQQAGLFQAYIDGVGSGTDGDNGLWDCDDSSYSVTFPNDGTADFDSTLALNLGRVASPSGAFKGDIDDFAIWTRALSSAEIGALYQGAAIVPEPGILVLLFGGVVGLSVALRRGRRR